MFCAPIKTNFIDKIHHRIVEADTTGKKLENGNAVPTIKHARRISRRHLRRHLPAPKGPHTVGIVDIMCESRGENGCFFRLYYPTASTDIFSRDRQWPLWLPRKQYAWGYVHFLKRNTRLFGKLFNWLGGDVYVPALWQAVPLQSSQPYPVIIFSHGIGGNRTTYTTLCLELASQGFVVAALEHRDGSASMTLRLRNSNRSSIRHIDFNDSEELQHSGHLHPRRGSRQYRYHPHDDNYNHHYSNFKEEWKPFEHIELWHDYDHRNKQMYTRAKECRDIFDLLADINKGSVVPNTLGFSFDMRYLKGQLDMEKVSIVGHSFGGATCIACLADDPRYKAGVILDGWMHPVDTDLPSKVQQPALMVNMEAFQWQKNVEQMEAMQKDTSADRPMITIKGTCHQSVSDFQFLCNQAVGRVMDVRYKLEPAVCMDLCSKAVMGFLWKHLGLDKPHFDDILSGEHELTTWGTKTFLREAPC